MFTLIRLLNDRPGQTVSQAAHLLDTTPRTVYHYLETLEDLGYCIDKDSHDRYFLFEADCAHRPAFTAEESALVVRSNYILDKAWNNQSYYSIFVAAFIISLIPTFIILTFHVKT